MNLVLAKIKPKIKLWINKLYSPKYLLWTNITTGMISISIGDAIEQYFERCFHWENKSNQHDLQRTGDDDSELN